MIPCGEPIKRSGDGNKLLVEVSQMGLYRHNQL
jgi:hypothetical protein